MASTSQQPLSNFSARPYGNKAKLPSTNNGRDLNRNERDRASHGHTGASNPFNSLSDEQREEILEAFNLFDLDKDQHIDYHEFKVALKALGFDLQKSAIYNHLTLNGIPKPGQATGLGKSVSASQMLLSFQAFQKIAAQLILDRDPEQEILRAFNLFDTDGKGVIDINDLRRVARELGEALDDQELAAMIDEFDLNGKGGVGKEEFINICMG